MGYPRSSSPASSGHLTSRVTQQSFFVLFALLLLFGVATVLAGTTGKIQGTVKDKETGEALAGVNVLLRGTQLGAATDSKGYYFITNIPPGTYSVVLSMIGYNTVVVEDVKVKIDLTTDVDVSLESTALQFETVVVNAERALIRPEVTNKSLSLESETIMSLPITSSQEVLSLQTGVVQVEGRFNMIAGFEDRGIDQTHVRGGRNGEIAYMVDGMYVEDAIYAGMGTIINRAAIEEMKIEVGGFNAEYGEAQSAVVNIVTKEGRTRFNGSLEASTSSWGDLDGEGGYKGVSERDALRQYHDFIGSLSGPIPGISGLTFFVSGEQSYYRDRVLEFDNVTYDPTLITDPSDKNFGKNVGDTTYTFAYGRQRLAHPWDTYTGWQGLGFHKDWDWNAKLTYSPSSAIKFNLMYRDTERRFRNYADYHRFAVNNRHVVLDRTDQQGLTFRHQLGSNSFYTINLNRFWKVRTYRIPGFFGEELGPGLHTQDWDHDGVGAPQDGDELWHYDPYSPRYPSGTSTGGFGDPMELIGFDSTYTPGGWRAPNGELLAGVPVYRGSPTQYWTRNFQETMGVKFDLTSQMTQQQEIKLGLEYRMVDIWFRELQYPQFENPYSENYLQRPREAAVYVQDQIDLNRVIINLGGRVDYANSKGELWDDPKNPTTPLIIGKDKLQFSPRIGFGYRVTDKTTFHFNYGHFFQVPEYRNLYVGTATLDLTTGRPLIGNPHLEAQKTVGYEFGIRQQLGDLWAVELTVWTKSLSGQAGTVNVIGFDPEEIGLYNYYVVDNYDHATTRGVDVTIDKRFGNYFEGQLNYTFSRATANRYYSWTGYWNSETAETEAKREILMPSDQTHTMNAWISFRTPDDFGPKWLGGHPLGWWRLNFVISYLSGYPYTPVTGSARAGEPNSARMPARQSVDLNVFKGFSVLGNRLEIFARVRNLFDRKNPLTVYSATGSPTEPDPSSTGYSTQFDRPDYFDVRRQIDLGVRFDF